MKTEGWPLPRRMPKQKPGRSKQDYSTPPQLLDAIKYRLRIGQFVVDLAANEDNKVCEPYYGEDENSLNCPWRTHYGDGDGWAWLNPPYADIEPWVKKSLVEAKEFGAKVVMLVPASVGSIWWKRFVAPYAYTVHLSPRVTFVGCTAPYPKDTSLLLYTPWGFTGTEYWNWLEYYKRNCLKET